MSLKLAALLSAAPKKNRTRDQILALAPAPDYSDGRTKQCHKDECDISKIMARFQTTGTISHLAKYEGTYSDFSDFDFFEQTLKLTQGNEIFAALPGELRREFDQSPQKFFNYVNDPANKDDLRQLLPPLAAPGDQLNEKRASTEPTVPVEPANPPGPDPTPDP